MSALSGISRLAISVCLILLTSKGSAETVMGNQLLSPPPNLSQAENRLRSTSPSLGFEWMANGSPRKASDNIKVVRARYRVITGKGSWICSPAGFGQRSRCYAG